jgi:MGT family glycosyltransferase
VLVSLSTVALPRQQRTLQTILDALAGLPVQAIVTTGPAINPRTLRAAANTRVHGWLDHADLLPTASLVIGHGGHSTTMRALSYGVPVLVIPSNPMLDQHMVGHAITGAGVGATLARGSTRERISAGVTRLLSDQSVQHAAAALGESIRQQDGATVAADLIQGWVTATSRVTVNTGPVDRTT